MNPSHLRLRAPLATAMDRFLEWSQLREIERHENVGLGAVALSRDKRGFPKGISFNVAQIGDWTVFEEVSNGYLADTDAGDLAALAAGGDLVYIGYNDSVVWARWVVVTEGQVVFDFSYDTEVPECNWSRGSAPKEATEGVTDWVDVGAVMGEDEAQFFVDRGTLWILAPRSS